MNNKTDYNKPEKEKSKEKPTEVPKESIGTRPR